MSERSIRSAKVSDAERCFVVLTLAFAGDPAARWAWPDQQQYLNAFPRFARAFGGRAVDAVTAHYIEGFCGVALWLPPGTPPDEESLVRVIEDTVADELRDAMFSMFEEMEPTTLTNSTGTYRSSGSILCARAEDTVRRC